LLRVASAAPHSPLPLEATSAELLPEQPLSKFARKGEYA
jgi:hypothetical protein